MRQYAVARALMRAALSYRAIAAALHSGKPPCKPASHGRGSHLLHRVVSVRGRQLARPMPQSGPYRRRFIHGNMWFVRQRRAARAATFRGSEAATIGLLYCSPPCSTQLGVGSWVLGLGPASLLLPTSCPLPASNPPLAPSRGSLLFCLASTASARSGSLEMDSRRRK